MDFDAQKDVSDKQAVRTSFRKPINDSTNRKYRHRSPTDRSDSSLSGSPKHDQSTIKNQGKELERDPGHSRSSRSADSRKHFDRHSYRSTREHHHDGGNEVRDSVKNSNYDQESRSSRFDRSKESTRNVDRNADSHHARDKYEKSEHRNAGKDREMNSRGCFEGRQMISRDHRRIDDRDDRDRRIRHRSSSEYEEENVPIREDCRGREIAGYRSKESRRNEIDKQECRASKRRYDDKGVKMYKDNYPIDANENRENDNLPAYRTREKKIDIHADKCYQATEEQSLTKRSNTRQSGKPCSSSKPFKETTEKFGHGPTGSSDALAEAAPDLNAAKVAAMKAAELVNKNLVGTGLMSTDQKKKLLWGNKKTISEEAGPQAGNRWDCQLFTDRERQEKFNKLMGVRGDVIPQERKPDEKDVEKQKELQTDLEKQYTAGLRRRDGRTVGLGL